MHFIFKVYHHCLFGVRYDFLCANYTAFDQTLFNCNFVSNVDCENSKKFWHRNDELYKTQSTTTAAPVIYNFRTPPSPQIYALTPSPVSQIPADQLAVIQQAAVQPQLQPVLPAVAVDRRRPRPGVRRRPAFDYYEYEERPLRERPRSRPYYYDYDDYEDDRYERRGSRRRRPYERRPMRRDKDRRRKYEDDYEEYVEEDDEEFTLGKKRRGDKRRKYEDDDEEEDKKVRYNRRRPDTDVGRKKPKRPLDEEEDDDFEYEERKRKPNDDSSGRETRKPSRVGARRPPSEVYEDDLQEADEGRLERRRKNSKDGVQTPSVPSDGTRTIIKPVSGTLYDRPRLAPKINLPVPKNAAHKYAYKPMGGQTPSAPAPEENPAQNPEPSSTTSKSSEDVEESRSNKRTKLDSEPSRKNIRRRPATTTEAHQEGPSGEDEVSSALQEESVGAKPRTVTRKFKRPFLPSRGGSPYTSRNLKPVGEKAADAEVQNADVEKDIPATSDDFEEGEIQERRPDKTKTYRVKSPLLIDVSDELTKSTHNKDKNEDLPLIVKENKAKTQDKPTESSIETFYENYDETLNEASPVNPLPFRKYPTDSGGLNSYLLNNRFYRSPLLSIDQSK